MFRVLSGRSRGSTYSQGIKVDYYAGFEYADYRYTSTVATINYDSNVNSRPPSNPASGAWTGKYTAKLTAQFTQTYTFYQSCEGFDRLYLNGVLAINAWSAHNSENTYGLAMTAGQPIDIQVDFYSDGVPRDAIQLYWSSTSVTKQIIPATAFTTLTPL